MPQELTSENEQPLPGHVASTVGLGATDWEAMTAHELALRFDRSAAWLLRGECFDGPHIGAGGYLAAATKLRQQANEIERAAAAITAIELMQRTAQQLAASRVHDSDCARHNAPAYPAGECDCGALGPNVCDDRQPTPTAKRLP